MEFVQWHQMDTVAANDSTSAVCTLHHIIIIFLLLAVVTEVIIQYSIQRVTCLGMCGSSWNTMGQLNACSTGKGCSVCGIFFYLTMIAVPFITTAAAATADADVTALTEPISHLDILCRGSRRCCVQYKIIAIDIVMHADRSRCCGCDSRGISINHPQSINESMCDCASILSNQYV